MSAQTGCGSAVRVPPWNLADLCARCAFVRSTIHVPEAGCLRSVSLRRSLRMMPTRSTVWYVKMVIAMASMSSCFLTVGSVPVYALSASRHLTRAFCASSQLIQPPRFSA